MMTSLIVGKKPRKKKVRKCIPDKEEIIWGKTLSGKISLRFSISGIVLEAANDDEARELIKEHRKSSKNK